MTSDMTSVKLRTARLTRGSALASEGVTAGLGLDTQEEENEVEQSIRLAPAGLRVLDRAAYKEEPDTQVVEKAEWAAFLVWLQLRSPSSSLALEPAHEIGHADRPRVMINFETIEYLNSIIALIYGKTIEVHVTHYLPGPPSPGLPARGAEYEQPYRPVTGLNVIVTHTRQWSSNTRESGVLREKDRWAQSAGGTVCQRAHNLYVLGNRSDPPDTGTRRGGSIKQGRGAWIRRTNTKGDRDLEERTNHFHV